MGSLPAMVGECAELARELWRRIRMEIIVELPLLRARWKTILLCGCFQYVHGMFTQLAHRMHAPQKQPLPDLGFSLFPELGKQHEWVSETIFGTMFASFLVWSFTPFFFNRKRFYTVVLYSRLLLVLTTCQTLRIISFLSTSLPAPNYHCRLGEATAIRAPATHWWDFFVVNIKRQSTHGCGDLIFSSHTTFALVGTLTYTEYGSYRVVKVVSWLLMATLSCLIIASRKHYSVDVVVAWYAVPLVFWAAGRRWTTKRPVEEGQHRGAGELMPAAPRPQSEVAMVAMEEGTVAASSLPQGASAHGASGSPAPNGVSKDGQANGQSPGDMGSATGYAPRSMRPRVMASVSSSSGLAAGSTEATELISGPKGDDGSFFSGSQQAVTSGQCRIS